MLMLITMITSLTLVNLNFNTSHVNVNRIVFLNRYEQEPDFNTSHVNVNPDITQRIKLPKEFQYISC